MAKILFDAQLGASARFPVPDLQLLRRRWRNPVHRLLAVCRTWSCRARERRVLGGMDDRMLADIGRTQGDIFGEVGKPFWRA
jgi:uncharacterized protein YjiS (DUF1127 family)